MYHTQKGQTIDVQHNKLTSKLVAILVIIWMRQKKYHSHAWQDQSFHHFHELTGVIRPLAIRAFPCI